MTERIDEIQSLVNKRDQDIQELERLVAEKERVINQLEAKILAA